MTKAGAFLRYIFFCLFFAVGATAIAISFLAPEILANLDSIQQLENTEDDNEQIKELIDIYRRKINLTENDPDVLKRLESKTFGIDPDQEDIAFPKASLEELNLAKEVLGESQTRKKKLSEFRPYLQQSARPKIRKGLFYAGAALILISFVCFGTVKPGRNDQIDETYITKDNI